MHQRLPVQQVADNIAHAFVPLGGGLELLRGHNSRGGIVQVLWQQRSVSGEARRGEARQGEARRRRWAGAGAYPIVVSRQVGSDPGCTSQHVQGAGPAPDVEAADRIGSGVPGRHSLVGAGATELGGPRLTGATWSGLGGSMGADVLDKGREERVGPGAEPLEVGARGKVGREARLPVCRGVVSGRSAAHDGCMRVDGAGAGGGAGVNRWRRGRERERGHGRRCRAQGGAKFDRRRERDRAGAEAEA